MHQAKYSIDVRSSKTFQVPLLNFLFASDERKNTSRCFSSEKKIANEISIQTIEKALAVIQTKMIYTPVYCVYPRPSCYVYVFNLSLISSTQ